MTTVTGFTLKEDITAIREYLKDHHLQLAENLSKSLSSIEKQNVLILSFNKEISTLRADYTDMCKMVKDLGDKFKIVCDERDSLAKAMVKTTRELDSVKAKLAQETWAHETTKGKLLKKKRKKDHDNNNVDLKKIKA